MLNGLAFRIRVLVLVAAAAGCDPSRALAPQSGSIEIAINGVPTDGIASVTAYIEDTHPPYNRIENQVAVGDRFLFDNLGVGFDIEFGIRNLGTHRCDILDGRRNGLGITDSTSIVETRLDSIEKISFLVRCRSGTLEVVVNGLPPGDSASIVFSSPADTVVGTQFRNGTRSMGVVPGPTAVLPAIVNGSDGFAYSASPQTADPRSAQTTTVTLDYVVDTRNQTGVEVAVRGLPDDGTLVFRSYIRSLTPPLDSDSATIVMDGTHLFPGLPSNVQYEVGLVGLSAYRCHIRVNGVWTFVGDTTTTTVTTSRSALPARAGFDLLCHTATLDVVVAGLPPGDSAHIDLDGVLSATQLHSPNGTSRLHFVPYAIRIDPQPVIASDGRTYIASPDTVQTFSQETTTVAVQYATQQPGSISGTVTGNGNGIGGATVTLSGDASAVATTVGGGAYTFANLPAGTYTLTVATSFPGISFPAPTQTVTLGSGENLIVNFAGTYGSEAPR